MNTKFDVHAVCLCVLLVGSCAIVGATVASGSADSPPEAEPSDMHTSIHISIGERSTEGTPVHVSIGWHTSYQARSAQEAARAQNGTLEPSWFRGDEVLDSIASDYPDSAVTTYDVDVSYDPEQAGHGEIDLSKVVTIDGAFTGSNTEIEFGPAIAEYLSPGDTFQIELFPQKWEPEVATTSPSYGQGREVYTWRIDEDPEPHFVLNESATQEDDGPLGTGTILPAVALVLVATLLAARAKRSER